MIVKDEVRNLPACLVGLASVVDEIIVVDTGSTDRTKELAGSLGARVSDFPWIDDFAAARNESCRLATGEWILWLDADERIDEANRAQLADVIGRLAAGDPTRPTLFMMDCVPTGRPQALVERVTQIRLFPNRPDLRWKGRVHERLEFAGDNHRLEHVPADVVILHEVSADPALRVAKNFRDMRILEQEYLADPDNAQTLLNFGRLRLWQGRLSEAQRLLRRSIAQDRQSAPIAALAFTCLAECQQRMNRDADALRTAEEGLSLFCDYAPLLYQKACLSMNAGRHADAEFLLRKIVKIPPRQWAATGASRHLQGVQARLMLGRICHQQGRHAEAEVEYRSALAHDPDCAEARFHLSRSRLSLGHVIDSLHPAAAQLSDLGTGAGLAFSC